jgi:hypothetical protein
MEQDNKYTLKDLLMFSAHQQPVDFSQAFDELMVDKLQAAVDARKLEIAQTIFNSAPAEQEQG